MAFGADDNTNTNFVGRESHGINNVFYKLKETLSANREGVGCPAQFIHNTAFTAADILLIDIESVILKFYKLF